MKLKSKKAIAIYKTGQMYASKIKKVSVNK